ncbi:MAG TPA: CHAT domain-containing protein [Streptosporangiaceae bacterium]|nr:CHAT domain-containing protein [Streptosporangiaceae bacterium]
MTTDAAVGPGAGPGPGELLRLAVVDPQRARAVARRLLPVTAAPAERIVVLRALGLASKELGRLDESLRCLTDALAVAESAGLGYAAAQVRMNLVGPLAARGDAEAALAAADAAAPVLRGEDADRLAANRACALARSGRMAEALAIARRVLPGLRARADVATLVTLVGLLGNIGLLRAFHGDLAGAAADLTEAAELADRAGLRHQGALARGNLAFVAARRGDVPRALELYDEVEPELAGAAERCAQLRLDRAETLIAVGLAAEARPLLAATVAEVAAAGYEADIADGLLLLACAELADGAPERAVATAARAAGAFAGQERTGWMLLAEHVALQARWTTGERSPALLHTAIATARRLERGGWREAAANSRVIAARLAHRLGLPAHALTADLSADLGRTRGLPAGSRVAAWHAIALGRAAAADRRGAMAAVRAGLRVAEAHAAALGAMELRARAAGLAEELAALGLRLARTGRELLAAEERRRAIASRPPAVRPPADPGHAATLAELRRVSRAHTEAVAAGTGDVDDLTARLVRLEAQARACARTRPGAAARPRAGGQSRVATDLSAALADRAFVQLIGIGGELHAVTVAGGRCRRRALGSYDGVVREVKAVRFELARLAEREAREGGGAAALTGLRHAAARVDAQLFGLLRRTLGDRELVLAPADGLRGMAWSALPSLAGRPVTVVASAAAWLSSVALAAEPVAENDANTDGPGAAGPGRTVLVAGPGLAHGDGEVAELALIHPGATVLRGAAARADAVRAAVDGAGLVHLAAHGTFRDGNALLSSVELADGPLTAYDLETLRVPPRLVVVSACDAGRAGEAFMGLPGVLLAFGTATVIASVTPVRDETARRFMVAVHRHLARGAPPAHALAAVPRSPGVLGFTCFGAGLGGEAARGVR